MAGRSGGVGDIVTQQGGPSDANNADVVHVQLPLAAVGARFSKARRNCSISLSVSTDWRDWLCNIALSQVAQQLRPVRPGRDECHLQPGADAALVTGMPARV
jgi:hypothetical protein